MENNIGIPLSPQECTLYEVSEVRQLLCLTSEMPLHTAHY